MDIWEKLFGKIGLWVIPLLIAAWLAQQIVPHVLKRDELNLQSELSLTTEEQRRIAESRNGTVPLLYNKLLEAEQGLNDLFYLHRPVGLDPPVVDPVYVLRTIDELRDLVNRTSVYFPASTCSLLTELSGDLCNAAHALETREMLLSYAAESGVEIEQDEIEQMETQALSMAARIPELRVAVEREFRDLLGTD